MKDSVRSCLFRIQIVLGYNSSPAPDAGSALDSVPIHSCSWKGQLERLSGERSQIRRRIACYGAEGECVMKAWRVCSGMKMQVRF
ncbi:hypothetical protein EVAR_28228_1 [Eumeta japonica]|uniref:Uncharacterized protein n=1 Tax=Eumeta variegata TaxID=151549 RepID=A0A4C1V8L6_EUMVA|nr:hypothetical protein EVAR_28228_1 [Eumeta japonica]